MPTIAATSHVTDSLLSASDDSFSSALALIELLSLFNLMWSKGTEVIEKVGNKINRGTWSSNSDHFHEKVIAKSKEFAGLPHGERLLMAIGKLQELMGVPAHDLRTRLDFNEVADDLCMAAVKILREDKKAKFTGNDVGAMIEFQMAKIFGGLNIAMDELPATQQQSLVHRVREFLQSLPAEQQRFIMDRWGLRPFRIRHPAGDCHRRYVDCFCCCRRVFGFAFYTTAARLLSHPLVASITVRSIRWSQFHDCRAFDAWMLPIFAGLWIWYYVWKNTGLRRSMAPLIYHEPLPLRDGGSGQESPRNGRRPSMRRCRDGERRGAFVTSTVWRQRQPRLFATRHGRGLLQLAGNSLKLMNENKRPRLSAKTWEKSWHVWSNLQ